jgi:hypothetical protein
MRIALVFAAVTALALASAGCCGGGYGCSACDGTQVSTCSWGCPKLPANCCGWDFYVPCDMIEGREARRCAQACAPCPCVPGQVVSTSYAVPVAPCAPPAVAAPAPPPALPPAPAPLPPPEVTPVVPTPP